MGLYFTWLFGCGYDSDSCRVQGLWSMVEKEEQTPPLDQKTGPGPRRLEKEKAWQPFELLRGEDARHMSIPRKGIQ